MRINLYTNVSKSQIRETEAGIWQILGIPMTVDNAVMNGILYPEDENAKGLNSYRGKPIALRHPDDGSARSGKGLLDHFAGGVIVNTYNHNGINYADAEFKESLMLGQDNGDYYLNKIKKGEPIGVSTGLYFEGNNACGKTDNGDEYHATAINQEGDHLALLPDDEAPAGGGATFIRFNGENNEQEITINVDEFISTLNSEEEKTLFEKIWNKCKQTFAPIIENGDNSQDLNTNDEGDAMRETLIAALAAKGITVNAEITDAELLAKYNEANTPDVAAAVNAALAPVLEKVESLSTELHANADKELNELAEKAAELMGVEVKEAKSMGVNALHKVLAKNGVTVGGPNATNHESPTEQETGSINLTPWEDK